MTEQIATFENTKPEEWAKGLASNTDPYGRRIFTYAADWAHMMEREIAAGKSVEECADACSREADTDGITGFMYFVAVSLLSQCWKHGETLRRWHNLKTQIGHEGERANESGTVLNPALLNIG
jgi:hypothetical protein